MHAYNTAVAATCAYACPCTVVPIVRVHAFNGHNCCRLTQWKYMCTQSHRRGRGGREQQMLGKGWGAGIVIRDLVSTLSTTREGRREGGGGRKGG